MIRKIEDFVANYNNERQLTDKVLRALTDASLGTLKSSDDTETIGGIAWHIASVTPYIVNQAGMTLSNPEKPATLTADAIVKAYNSVADELLEQLKGWTDDDLGKVDTVFGMEWPKGLTLAVVISHEVHHRGQLSVLIRQAGLPLPSIYGPNREETAAMMAAGDATATAGME